MVGVVVVWCAAVHIRVCCVFVVCLYVHMYVHICDFFFGRGLLV